MKKRLLFLFIPLLSLWSCSESEIAGPEYGYEPIMLSGGPVEGVPTDPQTRLIVSPTYATENTLAVSFARRDQDIDAGTWPADYKTAAALPAIREKGAGATVINFTTNQYYLNSNEKNGTKLIGWYPGGTDPKAGTLASGVVTFDIKDGAVDVMCTDEVTGAKFPETSKFGTGTNKGFTFNHVLTQIVVKAYAQDKDAKDQWGKIKSIKVKSLAPTCTVTLPATAIATTATVAFTGTAADVDLVKKKVSVDGKTETAIDYAATELGVATKIEGATDAEKNKTDYGYLMFAPTTDKVPATDKNIIILIIATEKEGKVVEKDYQIPVDGLDTTTGSYAKGNSYQVTLMFTVTKIIPTATIGAWVPFTVPEVVI